MATMADILKVRNLDTRSLNRDEELRASNIRSQRLASRLNALQALWDDIMPYLLSTWQCGVEAVVVKVTNI
jgi:hypothetical protein